MLPLWPSLASFHANSYFNEKRLSACRRNNRNERPTTHAQQQHHPAQSDSTPLINVAIAAPYRWQPKIPKATSERPRPGFSTFSPILSHRSSQPKVYANNNTYCPCVTTQFHVRSLSQCQSAKHVQRSHPHTCSHGAIPGILYLTTETELERQPV